jgi:hypothetical protein
MLGVSQRRDLIRALQKARFDAILFSGGGNDLVGDQLALWLKPRDQASGPADALRADVFEHVLAIVRRGYEDLLELRDAFARDAVVFVHAYSVPYPMDRGVCGLGPWLFPSLVHRGWTDPGEQRAVVDGMLRAFGTWLREWAAARRDVAYVDTLSLEIPRHSWANEIHPDSDGFDLVADRFADAVRERFGLGRGSPRAVAGARRGRERRVS